jgi:uncharacterized repeat protein (TIGR03803 family)
MPVIRLRVASAALAITVALGFGVIANPATQAQTFSNLYSFTGGTDGDGPTGAPALDGHGNLYGSAAYSQNGTGKGTVWKLGSGKLTVLHSFGATGDGAIPSGVMRDAEGTLYGATVAGGYGDGTIFKVSKTGKEAVLYRFTGSPDGNQPGAGLLRDEAGDLYGTTFVGGSSGAGTVFKLSKAGKETVLYSFMGPPDGEEAGWGTLVRDAKGSLYGVTYWGGKCAYTDRGCGTVFRLSPNSKGGWKETVLYRFKYAGGDGGFPDSSLLLDANGNLYGTTQWGGNTGCSGLGCGTVFKLDKNGKETVLYRFTGGGDGESPIGDLIQDATSNLYGTASLGANSACQFGCGTVFKLDANGELTVLHAFNGRDGSEPEALTRDSTGNFYGITAEGGDYGAGTVFKIAP